MKYLQDSFNVKIFTDITSLGETSSFFATTSLLLYVNKLTFIKFLSNGGDANIPFHGQLLLQYFIYILFEFCMLFSQFKKWFCHIACILLIVPSCHNAWMFSISFFKYSFFQTQLKKKKITWSPIVASIGCESIHLR